MECAVEQRLEAALAQVRELLSDRLRDLVYRSAETLIADRDDKAAPTPTASQPPARFWVVERPDQGIWWIWEPSTNRFHDDTPWLFADFYHRAGAIRGELIEDDFGGRVRFTQLSAEEASRLVNGHLVGGAGEKSVNDRQGRPASLELAAALAQVPATPA